MFIGITNFTEIMGNFSSWSMRGYTNIFGPAVYLIIYFAIVGYVYTKQQSAVAGAVAIIILSSAYIGSSVFAGHDAIVTFLVVITALTFTGLIVMFVARRRAR